jgi:hypothetical protein
MNKILLIVSVGEDIVFMLKYIIIAIVITILYIIYASLMKAAGKKTPVMPVDKHNKPK